MTQTTLDAFPAPLRWSGAPGAWYSTGDCLQIGTGADADMSVDPLGAGLPVLSAPRLLTVVDGDVQVRALVRAEFRATGDAGALLVWVDETNWAKLCFEQSQLGRPVIASVVTRGRSDNATGFPVNDNEVWLRISRLSNTFAFHASPDGECWRLVRHFPLFPVNRVAYGFVAQSPNGAGCTASFHGIEVRYGRLTNVLDAS